MNNLLKCENCHEIDAEFKVVYHTGKKEDIAHIFICSDCFYVVSDLGKVMQVSKTLDI